MDKDLQEYYESRFDMFTSKGWVDLIEDITPMIENYNTITNVSTLEELYLNKGRMDILNWLAGLKPLTEKAYEDLNEDTV